MLSLDRPLEYIQYLGRNMKKLQPVKKFDSLSLVTLGVRIQKLLPIMIWMFPRILLLPCKLGCQV